MIEHLDPLFTLSGLARLALPPGWAVLVLAIARRLRVRAHPESSGRAVHDASRRPRALVGVAVARLGRVIRQTSGRPPSVAADREVGLIAVTAAGVAIGAIAVVGPAGALSALAVPGLLRIRQRGRRRADTASTLTGALEAAELLVLALRGGRTVRDALGVVVPWLDGPVATRLATVLDRVERGRLLADELARGAADVTGPFRRLLVVLVAAERDGAPVVLNLERLTSELRAEHRRQLETAARRVPVRLLFPLVVGVLPAFVLLAIVPVLIAALGNVRGGH